MRKILLFLALALAPLTGAPLTAANPGSCLVVSAGPDLSYSPNPAVVREGSCVRWVNTSALAPHSVTSADGHFDAYLYPGGTFAYTFQEAGTYAYDCTVHFGMEGVVVVEALH